jgi:small subunit ribosomal protein S16
MALVIRLRKLGSRHQPHFRIAVTELATARDGRFVEEIGWYDPKKAKDNSKLDEERARYWLAKGAKPSETVRSILKKHNLLGGGAPAEAAPGTEPAAAETQPTAVEPEKTEPAAEPKAPPQPEPTAEQPPEETSQPQG